MLLYVVVFSGQFNVDRANAEEFYEVYKGVVKEYSVSVNAAFVLPPAPLSGATIWPRGLNTNTASRKVAKLSAVGVTISAMAIYSMFLQWGVVQLFCLTRSLTAGCSNVN